MSLVGLLIFVIICGLLFYCLSLLPLPQPWKNIALVLAILIVVLILLGMLGYVSFPIGRVR